MLNISSCRRPFLWRVICYEKHSCGELAFLSIMESKTEFYMCFWDALSCGEVNIVFLFLLANIKVNWPLELLVGVFSVVQCSSKLRDLQASYHTSVEQESPLEGWQIGICQHSPPEVVLGWLLRCIWTWSVACCAAEMCLRQRSFLWLPACSRT